ncbi:hypothetical protein GCM10023116_48650 [Kistimonas scapharcae]|uniref:Uncharacterized protein n=1 Tax=Kistimonas scapharcae TaxID=1036133 RepID=A0ABP8VB12_9GAMM
MERRQAQPQPILPTAKALSNRVPAIEMRQRQPFSNQAVRKRIGRPIDLSQISQSHTSVITGKHTYTSVITGKHT